jgi:hypothetical protein
MGQDILCEYFLCLVHINLSKKIITWKIYSQTAIVDLPIKTSNHLFSLNKSSKEKTVTVGSWRCTS